MLFIKIFLLVIGFSFGLPKFFLLPFFTKISKKPVPLLLFKKFNDFIIEGLSFMLPMQLSYEHYLAIPEILILNPAVGCPPTES